MQGSRECEDAVFLQINATALNYTKEMVGLHQTLRSDMVVLTDLGQRIFGVPNFVSLRFGFQVITSLMPWQNVQQIHQDHVLNLPPSSARVDDQD